MSYMPRGSPSSVDEDVFGIYFLGLFQSLLPGRRGRSSNSHHDGRQVGCAALLPVFVAWLDFIDGQSSASLIEGGRQPSAGMFSGFW